MLKPSQVLIEFYKDLNLRLYSENFDSKYYVFTFEAISYIGVWEYKSTSTRFKLGVYKIPLNWKLK